MSSLCNPFEFSRQYQSYVSAYSLADHWQRGDALRDFLNCLKRLGYINVGRSEVTTKNHPMIEVRSQFSLAKRLPDLVQIDLSNIWAEASAGSTHSVHTFEKTNSGFDAYFLSVLGSNVVTYCVRVVGTH